MAANPIPDCAKDLLTYDPESGEMRWAEFRNGNALCGALAGWVDSSGRRRIEIDGTAYLAHRVAYFLGAGCQPPEFIDHVNGDPSDNRLCNLRPATRRQNNVNRAVHANNSSGFRGVTFEARSGKYRARVGLGGKKVALGRFATAEEASAAYEAFTAKAYGEFYRPV